MSRRWRIAAVTAAGGLASFGWLDSVRFAALHATGIALRLDSIIGQIDAMPLLSDEKPVVSATQPVPRSLIASMRRTSTGGARSLRASGAGGSVTMIPAIASPLTNFEAPSIEP